MPGQAGDRPAADDLLGYLEGGAIVLAGKAFDADWLRRKIEADAARR